MASAFVVTGGPAVGKTTLITALTRLGYTTVRESARDIIIAEQALDSLVLPNESKRFIGRIPGQPRGQLLSVLLASSSTRFISFELRCCRLCGYASTLRSPQNLHP